MVVVVEVVKVVFFSAYGEQDLKNAQKLVVVVVVVVVVFPHALLVY